MRTRAVVLALVFLLSSSAPAVSPVLDEVSTSQSPTNPTGVDVRVVEASVGYTNSADEGKYKMFSSNHPILGFNRPAELFVIDGMVNITSTLTISVENLGTNPSGIIDINVLLLHDEYIYFEFTNLTVQMASLSGGATNTVEVDVSPSYAGNHTCKSEQHHRFQTMYLGTTYEINRSPWGTITSTVIHPLRGRLEAVGKSPPTLQFLKLVVVMLEMDSHPITTTTHCLL